MVFVSLEGVVGASPAAHAPSAAQQLAATQAPIRVVVTPGSAAKCNGSTGAPAASSSRRLRCFWRSDSTSHFVCFVTDGVVRHKWVVVKRAAECAALRKLLLRAVDDCKGGSSRKTGGPCSCRAVRALAKRAPSKSSKDLDSQYGQARALEEFLNGVLSGLLASRADGVCAATASALAVVESFLDVEARRADAVDRLVRMASSSMEDESTGVESEESPEQPSSKDCECAICCEQLVGGETLRLPCDHEFHADCVSLWLRMQQTCPVCRVAARRAV